MRQTTHERFQIAAAVSDRLLSAVAHQIGAAMLPTLRDEPALAENRAWKRLQFAAGAMADHIRGQKFALDQLRGSSDPETTSMDAGEWRSWFPQLLEGLASSVSITARFELEGSVSPALARALALHWVWIAAHGEEQPSVAVTVRGSGGSYAVTCTPMPATATEFPAVLTDAWSRLGEISVAHDNQELTASVEQGPA